MKKYLVLFVSVFFLSSCALIINRILFNPGNTWYFKVDFEKIKDDYAIDFKIADSVNLSKSAIRVLRKRNDKVYAYWVDVDTLSIYNLNKRVNVRLKIVGQDGQIKRFLSGWFDVNPLNKYDIDTYSIKETKRGDLVFVLNKEEFHLKHLGDEMGRHHMSVIRPSNIPKEASFNMNFEGYDYEYSWIVLKDIENGFFRLYKYSETGKLQDSIFAQTQLNNMSEMKTNYFFDLGYQSLRLYNNGQKISLNIDDQPYRGCGIDEDVSFLNSAIHSLKKGMYLNNAYYTLYNDYDQDKSFTEFRNEKSLQVLNNTIKAIGYDKFLSHIEFTKPSLSVSKYGLNLAPDMSISSFVDSLIFYSNNSIRNEYYTEFWERREVEGTKLVTVSILKDIRNYYASKESKYDTKFVNDTLMKCLSFDVLFQNSDSVEQVDVLKEYYEQLSRFGLHQSAFNLLFNTEETQSLEIDRASMEKDIDGKVYFIAGKRRCLNPNKSKWIE